MVNKTIDISIYLFWLLLFQAHSWDVDDGPIERR